MSLHFNLALLIAVLQVFGIQFNECTSKASDEFNAKELCRAIEGISFHEKCLLSEVVKQKGFIPRHLRPPWLNSSLFEDNELPADKATGDGCYACYKGTKASNGVNPGEEYCACTYKKQALNEKFGKIFGTFDFGNTTCIQNFHKMALMPKCGSEHFNFSIEVKASSAAASDKSSDENKDSSDSTLHINFGKFLQEIASNQTDEELKNQNNFQPDGPPPEFKLRIANRIYLANTFNVLGEFKSVINTHYGGNFESIDFAQNVAAAEKINAFVENSTNGKIKELVNAGDFNSQTKFVLVNAIYFKANWLRPFSDRTKEKLTFFLTNGQEIKLDMMQTQDKFIYGVENNLDMMQTQDEFIYVVENNFKILGMPYVGEKAHLFILLPNAKDGLQNLLNELKGAHPTGGSIHSFIFFRIFNKNFYFGE
uniref:SERPIN domain-containing protein n=1 Tax=Globodera pallida TaxID=36090 RepID=A0A183BTE6_GLOPA